MKNQETIKFRKMQLEVSNHAIERLQERFAPGVNLQDAIGRGKILNQDNVCKYPWQRKSFMKTINTTIQYVVNPYYNFKAVIDYATKTLITVEYLDASECTNYNYATHIR